MNRPRSRRAAIGGLVALTLLASVLVVAPARAVVPATGPIPECGPGGGNNCVGPPSEDTVRPLSYDTPPGTVEGPGIFYDFDYSSVGSGPLCPDEITHDDAPCQTGPDAFLRVYDPSKPPTDSEGGVPYGPAGVGRTDTCSSDLDCTAHIGVYPYFQPQGVTIIASVSYLQFEPEGTVGLDYGGKYYQVVLHLLPDSPPPEPGPPVAEIEHAPTGVRPYEWRFDGSGSHGDGPAVTITDYAWSFSDGTTRTGAVVTKTFPKGGPYTATLTVTDSEGETDTEEVEFQRPPVEVKIEPERESLTPGRETTVDVILTSLDPDHDASVTLDPPLESRDGLVEITDPTGAAAPHNVPAGGSTTVTFAVKAGEDLGADELSTAGAATDADGIEYDLSAKHAMTVSDRIVQAVLRFDPTEITLDEDADGPVPKPAVLHLSVTNTAPAEITDVALLLGNPGWQTTNPASPYVPSDVVVLTDPVEDDEYPIGDIAAGETVELDIPILVKDDGHIEWGGLMRYTLEGREDLESVEPGKLKSIPKYLTRFELTKWPGTDHIVNASIDDPVTSEEAWNTPQIVKAGETFGLLGEVENLTTDQVVMAEVPTIGLENITSAVFRGTGAAAGVYTAGLPYRDTIDPGSTEVVSSFPSTVENETFGPGETFSSRLTVLPKAAAPDEDGNYPTATADNVRTPTGLVASAPTMTPPVPLGPNAGESYLGRFAIGYTEGGIKFVKGTTESIGWIVSKIPEIPAMSAQAKTAFVEVGSRLVNGLAAVGTELYEMTPEERAAFAEELGNEALAFALVKTPDMAEAARQAIVRLGNQVVEKLIYAVVYDPDPGAFWQSLGSFTSQALGEISIGWLTDTAIAKVLIRLREAKGFVQAEQFLSAQAKAVGLKLEKGLAGIKSGTLITDRMLALGMGITRAQKDHMIEVARKWGVNIYSRSRGARSIELIEQGLATVKPYFIKPKSVNDIDKLFLGFEKLPSDVVAMRKPHGWDTVAAKMDTFVDPATGNGLAAEQRELIIDRWQKRNKEWFGDKGAPGVDPVASDANFLQSDRHKLTEKSGHTQNLTLETEGNLEDAFEGKSFQVKPTEFQLVVSPADPDALVPQLFEDDKWKMIVGDIDLVAITLPSGRVPSVETLLAIYQDLQKPPLNMQHSATLTWMNQGPAAAMLKDHLGDAAEPLIEVSVSSRLRAVRFDPKMSFENGDYYKNGAQFVHLAGGEINAPRNWALGGALTVTGTNIAHREYAPPATFPADMDRTALPTRSGPDGLETLVDGVWVPRASRVEAQSQAVTVMGAAASVPGRAAEARLVVGVQTAVDETVPAGTTALPVLSLSELYPDGTEGQQWFKTGDEVIVDPGTAAAFRTTLVKVGNQLVLEDSLPDEVLMGTMVAMVPEPVAGAPAGGAGPRVDPGALPPPVAGAPAGGAGGRVDPGALPRTGGDFTPLLQLAALLLGSGALLVVLRRRSVRRSFPTA